MTRKQQQRAEQEQKRAILEGITFAIAHGYGERIHFQPDYILAALKRAGFRLVRATRDRA